MITIVGVKPNDDWTLTLTFSNGKVGAFDVKPYLNKGIFRELKDVRLFKSVRIADATIEWKNGADLCPECVYENTIFKKIKKWIQKKLFVPLL